MRGLKPGSVIADITVAMSHLLQMRGLKHGRLLYIMQKWSRIFYRCVDWNTCRVHEWIGIQVASFTDAWIETLKYPRSFIQLPVASFTDAWIETLIQPKRWDVNVSHLLQMRGLKLLLTLKLSLIGLSHLLQMRGLKQQDQKYDDAQRMSHLLQMRGLKHEVANVTLAL